MGQREVVFLGGDGGCQRAGEEIESWREAQRTVSRFLELSGQEKPGLDFGKVLVFGERVLSGA